MPAARPTANPSSESQGRVPNCWSSQNPAPKPIISAKTNARPIVLNWPMVFSICALGVTAMGVV